MMQIRLFSNNLISKDRTPPRCAVLFFEYRKRTFNLPPMGYKVPMYRDGVAIGAVWNGQLPNITGVFTINGQNESNKYFSGAFADNPNIDIAKGAISGVAWLQGARAYKFDASRSSSVYSNSNTGEVYPRNINILYCIKY